MKAVVFNEYGGPEVLHETELPEPEPGPDDVLVRVGAVSVGRTLDIAARAGRLPFAKLKLPHVPGAEHAGEVVAAGDRAASRIAVGTRVAVFPVFTCGACAHCAGGRHHACPSLEIMGVHRQGAYAEYTAVPAENVRPVGDELSDVEAAALALSGPVAWHQFEEAGVREGTWLLVQAAGSALGSLTVALGLHRGARVIATSRRVEKRGALEELGVEAALDWADAGFADRVRELTGGAGVEVAIDNIGDEEMFGATLDVLGRAGTVVSSGAFVGGSPQVNLRSLYTLSQRVVGLRTANQASVDGLWAEVERGLRPVVDRGFPLTRAAEAHAHVERDENLGRVALVPS